MDPNTESDNLTEELTDKLSLNAKGKSVIFPNSDASSSKPLSSPKSKGKDLTPNIPQDDSSKTAQTDGSRPFKSKGKEVISDISVDAPSEAAQTDDSRPFKSKGKEVISPNSTSEGKSVIPPAAPKPLKHITQICSCELLSSLARTYHGQPSVVLRSSDGHEIAVPVPLAAQSGYVRNMLEMGTEEMGEEGGVVPVPLVEARVLMMLVQYWEQHVGQDGWDEEKRKEVDRWEDDFFEMIGPDGMYDLFIGANYIDARGCLERGAEYVADLIRKMKINEIREYFGMKNDFSPEEEEQLKKDFPWCNYDDM